MQEYTIHPFAELFPINEADYQSIKADMRENGFDEDFPIITLNHQVLDGRTRYRICQELGIKPVFQELRDGVDPLRFVVRANLHRRHLDASQRSIVAAKAATIQCEHGGDRRSENFKLSHDNLKNSSTVQQEAADDFEVGVASVRRAKKVVKDGIPELEQAVMGKKITVTRAYKIVCDPGSPGKKRDPGEQKELLEEALSRPSRVKTAEPEAEANGNGITSKGQGVQRANEAINCLKRIPKNDSLRKRGFQIVTDWIKANK